MGISKPSWVAWFLDGLNRSLYIPPWDVDVAMWTVAHKGDWLTWHANIGDWIETAIDGTLGAIDAAISAIVDTIPNLWDILDIAWSGLQTALEAVDFLRDWTLGKIDEIYAGMAWSITGVYDYIAGQVTDIYDVVWNIVRSMRDLILQDVVGMIDNAIETAIGDFRAALNLVDEYFDEMVDLFSDPVDWLFRKFTAMVERFW